jgi:hypothetical protein
MRCELRIPTEFMKRKLAWLGGILSAIYLLTLGLMPDFVPFIDEGIALAILINCASYLGYDVRKWLPFVPKKNKQPASNPTDKDKNVTIDV